MQNSQLAFLAFPAGFLLIWCGVVYLIAKLSGWSNLAESFVAHDAFDGESFSFRSAAFGKASYNNCLTIGANPRGLYIVPFFVFRMFHPPLLIPWHELVPSSDKKFFIETVEFTLPRFPNKKITIRRKLAEQLVEKSRGSLQLPTTN